jgi:hypothetical protein
MSAMNPKAFFEDWLPKTFAEAGEGTDISAAAEFTVLVEVGADGWWLALEQGKLSVTQPARAEEATFRIRTDPVSFEKLLTESLALLDNRKPKLQALRLDAETRKLLVNVPQGLKLVVDGETWRAEVAFSPGRVDPAESGCTLTCAMADLRDVQAGRANPMELFMNGRLKLDGNVEIAMALGGLFL